MKHTFKTLLLLAVAGLTTACSHSGFGRLVGGDRDDHGCLSAAGYMWSDARHDCVRVWEVGRRFDDGATALFLVFSTDSVYAEIFSEKTDPVLCRRVKGKQQWQAIKGKESVSISNDVLTVRTGSYNYTQSVNAQP